MKDINQVFYCQDFYKEINDFLASNYADCNKVIIIDEKVYELWGSKLLVDIEEFNNAEVVLLPSGEENKVIEICVNIWEALLSYEITRNDVIINIGGGVTTDMGAFVASTYKRGINFLNVPTTVMAQVDASHGGKTGIDLAGLKNVVGTFALPHAVFVNPFFLDTLPPNEIKSGLAEMLKHGLITDKDLWKNLLLSSGKLKELVPYIEPCATIKHKIIAQDFKESGERKKLNLGHTIGHGIESYFLSIGHPITHGEGVAYGILIESRIAVNKELLKKEDFDKIESGLNQFYTLPKKDKLKVDRILEFVKNDKKNSNNQIQMVLLEGIGKALIDIEVSESEIRDAFNDAYLTTS